jgi:peptidyl-prolyl cis-trans isomerase B (cyclophilin B)
MHEYLIISSHLYIGAICYPGMDVITSIAAIPTYKPAERIRLFNDFAQLIGDERAQTARAMWNRPLKTVYISDCGELEVTKQPLSPPSLP